MATIFGNLPIEENQEALNIPPRTSVLPTDPPSHQPGAADESSSCVVSISGYDHIDSESCDKEILADYGSNYTCVDSISRFLSWVAYLCSHLVLWIRGILSRRGSDACHVPFVEGLEAGRFCACRRNVIMNFCTADPGSCVHGGAIVDHSLHLNIGQNTNYGGDQTIGDVNCKEGYVRLQVNRPRDVFINGKYI